ncbi:MAG: hypothetical protein HKL80_09165 [Acidimicrobiales bacterium]|nr:hypothetical protein [Acidimicrobiales bacterium]
MPERPPNIKVLTVCTGNICRSPMAEAFLQTKFDSRGIDAEVSSAGLLFSGRKAAKETIEIMSTKGFDLSGHRSRILDEVDLYDLDLIVGMTKEHVREIVVMSPALWPVTFTLKGLVASARNIGPRNSGEPLLDWLNVIGETRTKADLLGADLSEDIVDPYDLGPDTFLQVADEIDELTSQAVKYIAGTN